MFFFYVVQQRFLNFYLGGNVQSPSDFTWNIIKQNVFHSFVGVDEKNSEHVSYMHYFNTILSWCIIIKNNELLIAIVLAASNKNNNSSYIITV